MPRTPTKKIKKVYIIINPASGRPDPILPVINTVLKELGVAWEIGVTHKAHDASAMAREAIKQGVDAIGVYGGDGTVREVISGMIGSDVPLAILPGGTANVLATELEIPKDLKSACELMCGVVPCRTQSVDVGKFNTQYFILRLGLGFEADMVKGADRKVKNRFGRLAYVLSAAKAFKDIKQVNYHLKIDGKEHEVHGVTCIIANSGNVGFKDLSLEKHIDVSDGLLDVVVVRHMNISLFAHIVTSIFHKEPPENIELVEHWQGKDIHVSVTPKQVIQCDGEIGEKAPVHAKIIPAAIRIIVPKDPSS